MTTTNIELDVRKAFETDPPALDFILPGLLAGTVGSIIAPGSTGKSFYALELGLFVSTGGAVDLVGIEIENQRQRKVVYITAEDPLMILQCRMHALGEYVAPALRELVYENFDVYSLYGYAPYLIKKEGNGYFYTDWVRQLKDVFREYDLVFLDTLSLFHALEENSGSEMKMLVDVLKNLAKEAHCSILFLHHSNKLAMQAATGAEQQASRGSSVLTDNIRYQINLVKMTKDEADIYDIDHEDRSFFISVNNAKINYGVDTGRVWLKREKGGVLVATELQEVENSEKRRR